MNEFGMKSPNERKGFIGNKLMGVHKSKLPGVNNKGNSTSTTTR